MSTIMTIWQFQHPTGKWVYTQAVTAAFLMVYGGLPVRLVDLAA